MMRLKNICIPHDIISYYRMRHGGRVEKKKNSFLFVVEI